MASVEIPENYLEILSDFGDTTELAKTAVRRYSIELATKKMDEYKNIIEKMESKYGCDYKSFISLSVNNEFRKKVLKIQKDWKKDLMIWEENTEKLSHWVGHVARLMR